MQFWWPEEHFCRNTRLPGIYVRFRIFILLVKIKNLICMSSWRPWRWVTLDYIITIRNTYTNFKLNPAIKFTSSTEKPSFFIPPWNISQIITKADLFRTRIVLSYLMQQGNQFRIWQKVKWNCDYNMIKSFQWKEIHFRTNTSARINE